MIKGESVEEQKTEIADEKPRAHIESPDCWCGPELVGDYEDDGGTQHYIHKEIQ